MSLTIGTEVLYKGKPGVIVWIYNNGQCEYLDYSTNVVSVVSIVELTIF